MVPLEDLRELGLHHHLVLIARALNGTDGALLSDQVVFDLDILSQSGGKWVLSQLDRRLVMSTQVYADLLRAIPVVLKFGGALWGCSWGAVGRKR